MRISSSKMNLRVSWDISILLSLKSEHIEEIAVYCLYCGLAIKDYWEGCPFIACQDFWGLGFKQNKFCNITFPCCEKVKESHSVEMATWALRYLPWAGWFTTKQIVIISFHVFPGRLIFYWIQTVSYYQPHKITQRTASVHGKCEFSINIFGFLLPQMSKSRVEQQIYLWK